MTKVFAHRGASGVALENTLEAFRAAKYDGADGIELDIRATSDGQIVVCHDAHLSRISDSRAAVRDVTYTELQKIRLHNGEYIPLLTDVLNIVKDLSVIIEVKVSGQMGALRTIIKKYPKTHFIFQSLRRDILVECHEYCPDIPTFIIEGGLRYQEMINVAKATHATGVNLNYKLLNPVTYWQYRRHGLQIVVYTVNRPLIGKFISKFYPEVWICSDYPNRLVRTTSS